MPRTMPACVALVTLLTAGAGVPRGPMVHLPAPTPAPSAGRSSSALLAPCPEGMLPDGDACVRIPHVEVREGDARREAEPPEGPMGGGQLDDDRIPLRPDRPATYDAYRFPVPCGGDCVVGMAGSSTGDEPTDAPGLAGGPAYRRDAIGLSPPPGARVQLVSLDHQEGDARVVYVGPLFGTTVITAHRLREAGRSRDYLLIFGHLGAAAPGLVPGTRLKDGDLVGFAEGVGSRALARLSLEARRVRPVRGDGNVTDARSLSPFLPRVALARSIACDLRNVLPLH